MPFFCFIGRILTVFAKKKSYYKQNSYQGALGQYENIIKHLKMCTLNID